MQQDNSADPGPQGRNWPLLIAGTLLLFAAAVVLLFGQQMLDRFRPADESAALQQIPAFGATDTNKPDNVAVVGVPVAGDSAPGFSLLNLAGEEVALQDMDGRPVILNFWATWCAPCRLEMPELENTQQRYSDGGLTVLTINQAESAEQVSAFYDELGLTMPALLDTDGDVAALYGAHFLPSTVFINADGQVTAIHRGIITASQVEDYLQATLPPQS